MKKLMLTGVVALGMGLMSFINSPNELAKVKSNIQDTPHSWCEAGSLQFAEAYAGNNPGASFDDIYDAQVSYYTFCRAWEDTYQLGNW